ncbi:DUF1648 domain-containing protein [Phytoactinopolyspora alkaliphila]|uniref:DUF1648 domain-containing protein n=1 Tax=Phytoactinopolyspora alkaliphila TaxID=1783498 RepID=A0A6N9YK14_9ACTN|nr:DUF1648 domain-containing protein [Phytoactinopolyspora alkaliphila]NED95401.1 DUF1648 domain-containing protein [Phytoactinopolyspora alkaliphila]
MNQPTVGATSSPRPIVRIVLAAAALPMLIALAGALLVWSWRDELPSPMATHWGIDGEADGFTSVATTMVLILAFGAGFAVLGLVLSLLDRTDTMLARVGAGTAAGTTGFVTGLMVLVAADQRGLADAAGATADWSVVAGGLGLGAAAAVIAVILIPRWTAEGPNIPHDAPRVPVADGETVVWTRSVATGSHVVALLVVIVGVTAIITLVSGQWLVLISTLLVIGLLAMMLSIRVTVDQRGLTITGVLGWPKFHTSLDEISHASTTHVKPIRHFGGYGFRVAVFGPYKGASGFVMRGGNAILLERTSGRRTVVVVDDAVTAAGLLNTLVERTRST